MNPLNRRELLTQGAAGVGATMLVSTIATRVAVATASPQLKLNKGDTILFQGDSITDCHRQKKRKTANDAFNRGISGNRVPSLQQRWDKDCIALKPNVLSILVGVNDIWHKLNGKYKGTTESYRVEFTELLAETKRQLPETTIVICEPFALKVGAVTNKWFPEFDDRRQVAREVCDAAGATWVPFQSMFDQAIEAGPPAKYWAADGVHPSMAGHALMAATWQKVVLG